MNTVGIVFISLLGGLLLALLLGCAGWLIYLLLQFRKLILNTGADFTRQNAEVRAAIRGMNGDALLAAADGIEKASTRIVKSAERIEKAVLAFHELNKFLVADIEQAQGKGIDPEAYAEPDPEGKRYVTQSDSARMDDGVDLG